MAIVEMSAVLQGDSTTSVGMNMVRSLQQVLAGESGLAVQHIPAAGTFSRSSVAYKSDGTQVAVDEPRFEPGKFG